MSKGKYAEAANLSGVWEDRIQGDLIISKDTTELEQEIERLKEEVKNKNLIISRLENVNKKYFDKNEELEEKIRDAEKLGLDLDDMLGLRDKLRDREMGNDVVIQLEKFNKELADLDKKNFEEWKEAEKVKLDLELEVKKLSHELKASEDKFKSLDEEYKRRASMQKDISELEFKKEMSRMKMDLENAMKEREDFAKRMKEYESGLEDAQEEMDWVLQMGMAEFKIYSYFHNMRGNFLTPIGMEMKRRMRGKQLEENNE